MPESTGDEARRQREAVQRELQRRGDDGGDADLVDTVGEEQRRERARDEDTDDEEDG